MKTAQQYYAHIESFADRATNVVYLQKMKQEIARDLSIEKDAEWKRIYRACIELIQSEIEYRNSL